jgi:hypothetical protein
MLWSVICGVVVACHLDQGYEHAWFRAGYLSAASVVLVGLLSMALGLNAYWRRVRHTPARGLARSHMWINSACLTLFTVSLLLLRGGTDFQGWRGVGFGLQGIALLAVAAFGWIGVELRLEIASHLRRFSPGARASASPARDLTMHN